jgi:AraC-like DNA-binding protein
MTTPLSFKNSVALIPPLAWAPMGKDGARHMPACPITFPSRFPAQCLSFCLSFQRLLAKETGVQDKSFRCMAGPDLRERVLHLRVAQTPVQLNAARFGYSHWLPVGWEGLIVLSDSLHWRGGELQVLPVCEAPLMKLQAFFDMSDAFDEAGLKGDAAPWALLPVADDIVRSPQRLERWYIEQAMGGTLAYLTFAETLRHHESYGLVRFLLEQGTRSVKLNALAQRYGVSVSHFRRLCRQALGTAAKPALRSWRTAQALLNMSLRDGSLTDVALEFGFASSSHFSKEVRELVGFAPSSLADITYLPGHVSR